jgi:hypothetical protein
VIEFPEESSQPNVSTSAAGEHCGPRPRPRLWLGLVQTRSPCRKAIKVNLSVMNQSATIFDSALEDRHRAQR